MDIYIQVDGVATNVNALSFIIYDVSTLGTTSSPHRIYPAIGGPQTVDLTACPSGNRISTGHYYAPYTPNTVTDGANLNTTYQIRWFITYKGTVTEFREEFTVIDPTITAATSISATATATATSTVIRNGVASISSGASITTGTGMVTHYAVSSASAGASITLAKATGFDVGSASISSGASVSTTGTVNHSSANNSISAGALVSTTGLVTHYAITSDSSGATATATGVVHGNAEASVTASGATSTTGVVTHRASDTVSGAGTATGTGTGPTVGNASAYACAIIGYIRPSITHVASASVRGRGIAGKIHHILGGQAVPSARKNCIAFATATAAGYVVLPDGSIRPSTTCAGTTGWISAATLNGLGVPSSTNTPINGFYWADCNGKFYNYFDGGGGVICTEVYDPVNNPNWTEIGCTATGGGAGSGAGVGGSAGTQFYTTIPLGLASVIGYATVDGFADSFPDDIEVIDGIGAEVLDSAIASISAGASISPFGTTIHFGSTLITCGASMTADGFVLGSIHGQATVTAGASASATARVIHEVFCDNPIVGSDPTLIRAGATFTASASISVIHRASSNAHAGAFARILHPTAAYVIRTTTKTLSAGATVNSRGNVYKIGVSHLTAQASFVHHIGTYFGGGETEIYAKASAISNAGVIRQGRADITSGVSAYASAIEGQPPTVILPASSFVFAGASIIASAQNNISISRNLHASAIFTGIATHVLPAVSALSAGASTISSAQAIRITRATISASAQTTVLGSYSVTGHANINALANITATVFAIKNAVVSRIGGASFTGKAVAIHNAIGVASTDADETSLLIRAFAGAHGAISANAFESATGTVTFRPTGIQFGQANIFAQATYRAQATQKHIVKSKPPKLVVNVSTTTNVSGSQSSIIIPIIQGSIPANSIGGSAKKIPVKKGTASIMAGASAIGTGQIV